MRAAVLDPRFPEVRRFLVDTYARAMKEWDLDGFKLDFIDAIRFWGEDPAEKENFKGRDIKSVPIAVEKLMTEVHAALTAIKPDALVEFRQGYVGPGIRKFGNMLRVGDCPGSARRNRVAIANLRLASGDTAAVAKADEEIAVITAKTEQDKEAARVEGYKRRRQIAVDAERKLDKQLDQATKAVEEVNAKRQAMLGDPGRRGDRSVNANKIDESSAWGRANAQAIAWFGLPEIEQNHDPQFEAKVKDFRDRAFREERKKLYASDEWKKTNEDQKAAQEVSLKAADELFKARQKIADIDAEEKRRVTENAAKKKEAEAKAIADNTAAEKKAIADAAAAQTEFERAFAMYRDPERARAEIAEERDRSDDLKRLHKDASRYGGKWRIDELAELMSAGDTEGVDSRLEEWRKRKSFTPEVEAMVRASAAEQTRTTAEDELRKIEGNTRDLSEKLDQLLTMKGN